MNVKIDYRLCIIKRCASYLMDARLGVMERLRTFYIFGLCK